MAKASRRAPEKSIETEVSFDSLTVGTIEQSAPTISDSNIDSMIESSFENEAPKERVLSAREILAAAGVANTLNEKIDVNNKSYKLLVTLRKIAMYGSRLGMANQPENFNLVPGTGQTFVPFMVGDNYLTGLEDKPEIKARLEKTLRVSLNPDSSYYEDLRFRMEDRVGGQIMVIEDNREGARMEVIYYAMIASPIIANGLQEYQNGTKPEAQWYIENREAESEQKQKVISDERTAFRLFDEMSPVRKAQIAKNLGLKVWGLSDAVTLSTLWDYLKLSPKDNHGVSTIGAFLKEAQKDDTTIAVKALVRDAIHYNIIRKNGAGDFKYGDENLGGSLEIVESKLSSPSNIQLRHGIEQKVNLKAV